MVWELFNDFIRFIAAILMIFCVIWDVNAITDLRRRVEHLERVEMEDSKLYNMMILSTHKSLREDEKNNE